MRASPLHLSLLLAACVRPSASPPRAQPAEAPPQQRPPRLGCDTPGPKFRVTDENIILHDQIGEPRRSFVTGPGRLLRLDGDVLYFFDLTHPVLKAVGESGYATVGEHAARTVLELPPLAFPGFSSDPLIYLQRQEDLSITDHILCMDLHDLPIDPTLTYNLRIDLTTGTVERRLVHDLGSARRVAGREAVRPRLCTPAGPSAAASEDGDCVYLGWHNIVPLRRDAAPKPAAR